MLTKKKMKKIILYHFTGFILWFVWLSIHSSYDIQDLKENIMLSMVLSPIFAIGIALVMRMLKDIIKADSRKRIFIILILISLFLMKFGPRLIGK